MSIEKLEEFARDGQKNTDELILTDGFPRPKFPARQWFNYLFNMLSLKINEIIDLDPVARSEIIDNLTTNDANKPVSAKQAKVLQDNKLGKTENAASATKLATARTIAISGAVTGTATGFDGSANIAISTTAIDGSKISTGTVPVARLPAASTSAAGAVKLNNTLTSTSTTEALTAAQGKILNDQAFGVGQTRKDVSASRLPGTTYFNATQKAFFISITIENAATAANQRITIEAGGIKYMNDMVFDNDSFNTFAFTFPVLPGESWYYNHTGIGNRIIVEVS